MEAIPTTGRLRVIEPADPLNRASPKLKIPPSDRHQPVAPAVRGGRHAHHRLVEGDIAGRTFEAGVAEAEDPAIRGHQPVAPAVGGGGHAHYRPVEGVEPSIHRTGRPRTEDAAVRCHQPVTAAVGVAAIPTTGLFRGIVPVEP